MPRKNGGDGNVAGQGIVPENTVCIDAAKFGPFDDVRFRNGVTVLVEDVVKMVRLRGGAILRMQIVNLIRPLLSPLFQKPAKHMGLIEDHQHFARYVSQFALACLSHERYHTEKLSQRQTERSAICRSCRQTHAIRNLAPS
jgi:hypothetical protein